MSSFGLHQSFAREDTKPPAHTGAQLRGIHGLRFLAALMVMMFHVVVITSIRPPIFGWFVGAYFASGVRLFFVISAFSLMHSTPRYLGRPDWVKVFFIKRYFRIAPLFYVMMCVHMWYYSYTAGVPLNLHSIILNLTFMFNFLADQAPSLSSVGWTLGVEMIFYAIFPSLLGVITSLSRASTFTLLAMAISASSLLGPHVQPYPALSVLMAFPGHLQFFAAGILAYFLFARSQERAVARKHLAAACGTVVAVSIVLMVKLPVLSDQFGALVIEYGATVPLFVALCVWQAVAPLRILSNHFVVYWGERSFSMYLLHVPILLVVGAYFPAIALRTGPSLAYVVCTGVLLTLTLGASYLTYRFIEAPGMRLGQWLYRPPRLKAVPPAGLSLP